MGVVKATVGVVDGCVLYNKCDPGFMVLSCSLDVHDLLFLLFPTSYRQVALAEMLTTRDLAIFYDDNDRTDY